MRNRNRITRIKVIRGAARVLIMSILTFLILMMVCVVAKAEKQNEVVAYAKCTSGTINIRDKGDISGDEIGYLFDGDKVIVVGQKNGWTHILVGIEEGQGWVKSEFITADTEVSNSYGEYINNSCARVRIRKKIESTKNCSWLEQGRSIRVTSVTIDQDGNDWGRVELGWVMMSFLTKVQ